MKTEIFPVKKTVNNQRLEENVAIPENSILHDPEKTSTRKSKAPKVMFDRLSPLRVFLPDDVNSKTNNTKVNEIHLMSNDAM